MDKNNIPSFEDTRIFFLFCLNRIFIGDFIILLREASPGQIIVESYASEKFEEFLSNPMVYIIQNKGMYNAIWASIVEQKYKG